MSFLKLEKVTKVYNSGAVDFKALSNVSFELNNEDISAIEDFLFDKYKRKINRR